MLFMFFKDEIFLYLNNHKQRISVEYLLRKNVSSCSYCLNYNYNVNWRILLTASARRRY